MDTLVNQITWRAAEHPQVSRGMIASGAGFLSTRAAGLVPQWPEECCVMTGKQAFLMFNFSRTSVFEPNNPGQGGVIGWRTREEAILTRLHNTCVEICNEVGFSEFCVMCEASGPSALLYWEEMLGPPDYSYLKKRA